MDQLEMNFEDHIPLYPPGCPNSTEIRERIINGAEVDEEIINIIMIISTDVSDLGAGDAEIKRKISASLYDLAMFWHMSGVTDRPATDNDMDRFIDDRRPEVGEYIRHPHLKILYKYGNIYFDSLANGFSADEVFHDYRIFCYKNERFLFNIVTNIDFLED
jgi:hypothetical protein